MKKRLSFINFLPVYLAVFGGCILLAAFSNRAVTAIAENVPLSGRINIIIDAGHGGEDGGAVSYTGVYESKINLEISVRLNELLRFLGYQTQMIRTEDISMHTEGDTIAAHKVSDLKKRVEIINEADNALLVSIHQNSFPQNQYHGAQVFYANDPYSKELGDALQASFISALNHGSNRSAKKASGIYMMEHIQCPGILVECGFLSNAEEEAKLREGAYQKKICCVIASVLAKFINT